MRAEWLAGEIVLGEYISLIREDAGVIDGAIETEIGIVWV